MFKDPHIIYVLSKQKHEEFLAECHMMRLAGAAKKCEKKKTFCCRIILFLADVLIKSGVCLKRRWEPVEENPDNMILISSGEK